MIIDLKPDYYLTNGYIASRAVGLRSIKEPLDGSGPRDVYGSINAILEFNKTPDCDSGSDSTISDCSSLDWDLPVRDD
jgi:hypothetical protein